MRDVHPHWHTTHDDAEHAVPVADTLSRPAQAVDAVMPQGAVIVSRKPAAIVGILVVLAIGYSLLQGIGGLLGQLTTEDKVLVRITAQGFNPTSITVKPGQKIVWRNEDSIPHIIYSDKIQVGQNESFQTSPIFKNGEAEFVMPLEIAKGEFPYASRTKAEFTGIITVEIPATVSSSVSEPKSSAPSAQSSRESSSSSEAFSYPPTPSPTDEYPPLQPEQPTGGIPQNPYTIDSSVIPNPSMSGQATSRAPLFQQTKGKPQSQPESGPGAVWVIGIFSAAILLACTRKAFKA
jgi:plastocyanin